MKWLATRLRTRTVLWASAAGAALNMIALRIEPYPHAVDSSATIWDLQFAGTAERFVSVLNEWVSVNGSEAIDNAAKSILRLDYTFPVLYGVFFASVLAYLWTSEHAADLGRWLPLLPLIAGLCDMAENTLHLALLADLPPIDVAAVSDGMVAWATRFALIKYGLLAVSVGLIVIAAVRAVAVRHQTPVR